MKVFSQLVSAQLENKSSDYSAGTNGRIWFNTSSSLAKFDDGAAIRTVVTTDNSQTLTNKTITGSGNTISGLLHGTQVDNPTSGVHGVTGSVVGTSDSQTITNKTIDSDNNVITNIVDADIKSTAAITRSKTASGTAYRILANSSAGVMSENAAISAGHVVFGDSNGQLSGESTLATTRGGTAIGSYTTGDLIYASSGSVLSKLGVGSTGQILKVAAGLPSWGSAGSTLAVTSKTSNYTILSTDDAILCDTSGGAFTLTLPAASAVAGKFYWIKLVTAGNLLNIARAGSDTFTNSFPTTLKLGTAGDVVGIFSDGSSKWIVAEFSVQCGARCTLTSTQTIGTSSATIVNFNNKAFDPLGQVTTGASWNFTAIYPGRYMFEAGLGTINVAWTADKLLQQRMLINSTNIKVLQVDSWASVTTILSTAATVGITLSVGDSLSVQCFHDRGSDTDLDTSDGTNNTTIYRIGD